MLSFADGSLTSLKKTNKQKKKTETQLQLHLADTVIQRHLELLYMSEVALEQQGHSKGII